MQSAQRLGVCAIVLLFLSTPGVQADLVGDLLSMTRAGDYYSVAGYYMKFPGLFSNYNRCRARGFSEEVCHSAMAYCALNEIPLGGVAGAYISMFELNQLFRADCGSGECFACCFVPGNGCHSAFHSEDGSSVINCNGNYGPGTHQVGRTLVVDPDAQPGQACLFTPQTCDHVAICNSTRTSQQIESINNNPLHIMKSDAAVEQRALSFAEGVLADWSNFLASYHSSSSEQSDYIRLRTHPYSSLDSFLTGRGCAGWRHRLPASFPTDWSEPQFRIDDANGAYAEEASHYNGIRQLGLVQLIAGVPNLYNRLAFVESRVWTPSTISQYVAPIGDPDTALLRHMSPMALEVLKKNKYVQDYRLLAVPLNGETVPERLFNGCLLADPPELHLSYQKRGALGIDLRIEAADSAASADFEVGLLVIWGDGGVTRLAIPPGGLAQTVSHDYAAGGLYQVETIAENEAGLRAFGAVVAETAGTGTNPAQTPVPILNEIQLVDLRAVIESTSGNDRSMMFELESWPTSGEGYTLGVSRTLTLHPNTPASFGTIAGWNMRAAPLQGVTIRPSRWGDGYLIGFKGNYFSLEKVRVGVYSTQDNQLRHLDIPVTAEMVRLYPTSGGGPVLLTQPNYGTDGRLKIPVQIGDIRYARIDLVFSASVLSQAVQGPVTNPTWIGITGTLPEVRPKDRNMAIPPSPLDFYSVAPCRLVDTRGAAGPLGAPALPSGLSRTLNLTGVCGIPADAKALSLNVTATNATGNGNIKLFPADQAPPTTSTINFMADRVRANNAILGLSETGELIALFSGSGQVDLVLDVNGYFK